ncbi:MAG: hypothetical protein SFV20_06890 [Sphingopyxis sp.]|nr:hypothetical protein [Sphingopyxis sp.]
MHDATAILDQLAGALDGLAAQIHGTIGRDEPLNEVWGWNMPGITRSEFAALFREPVSLIQSMENKTVSETDFSILNAFPARLNYFQGNALPNVAGGSAWQVYVTAVSMLDALMSLLRVYAPKEPDWAAIDDNKLIPASQLKRLRNLNASIEKVTADSAGLAETMQQINAARSTAESLPADLLALEEAKKAYEAAMREIGSTQVKIAAALSSAAEDQSTINALKNQAEQLVANTEAAQAAATTQGLGAAFDNKAKKLGTSTFILGGILTLTLGTGAWISSGRIKAIQALIDKPEPSFQLLWVQVILAGISVAGPVWLAWILTKQIGQRFRLAEDYAFKAAVAKAFEGYRREAVKVDPSFEKRLFSSILDRLDEAPLRHVERENHGSPWAELVFDRFRRNNPSFSDSEGTKPPD